MQLEDARHNLENEVKMIFACRGVDRVRYKNSQCQKKVIVKRHASKTSNKQDYLCVLFWAWRQRKPWFVTKTTEWWLTSNLSQRNKQLGRHSVHLHHSLHSARSSAFTDCSCFSTYTWWEEIWTPLLWCLKMDSVQMWIIHEKQGCL